MSGKTIGVDCCGDRYSCNTTAECKCGCGTCYCRSCYESHCVRLVESAIERGIDLSAKRKETP